MSTISSNGRARRTTSPRRTPARAPRHPARAVSVPARVTAPSVPPVPPAPAPTPVGPVPGSPVTRVRSVRAAAVLSDLQLVRNSLRTAGEGPPGSDAVREICSAELTSAEQVLEGIDARRLSQSARDARLEYAWTAVHRARALLPLVVADDALEVQYLYAVERATRMRPRDARLLASIGRTASSRAGEESDGVRRRRLSYALSAAYCAADREHQQMRVLRDRLVRVAWLTFVALVVVVAAGTLVPTLFPLCSVAAGRTICPAGGGAPTAGDVATVVFLGVIGAGLTAVLAIRRAQPSQSPYRLMPVLGFLRIPLGGIVAVLGVVLMQSGVVPGFDGLQTTQQIAVYAIVFGFAQEAVTRLLENRARAVQDVTSAGSTLVEPTAAPPVRAEQA
ncbi:hypothetical protein Celgi_1387 [Cellulomonas gilvus ATCC 13127]|uniref:Uncharacterized protein n=1 Tax=Cellulomonas gilvus (strain ATCC 13127 / NRRL B-14078) TaxID=593907 RepID=F8A351_CELGA|nr:hypothetical protein Celgi_1387 [Cellulomonas gilvus ATCC 13127]